MKRLFMLRVKKRGAVVTENNKPLYFENKVEAKALRNKLRDGAWPDCVVSYGPDHHRYIGE